MNVYDFLLSLDRLDGQLIDETMDCLYPKERRGGRRVVRTLLIAAVFMFSTHGCMLSGAFSGFVILTLALFDMSRVSVLPSSCVTV